MRKYVVGDVVAANRFIKGHSLARDILTTDIFSGELIRVTYVADKYFTGRRMTSKPFSDDLIGALCMDDFDIAGDKCITEEIPDKSVKKLISQLRKVLNEDTI
jgi:hypothetical protein